FYLRLYGIDKAKEFSCLSRCYIACSYLALQCLFKAAFILEGLQDRCLLNPVKGSAVPPYKTHHSLCKTTDKTLFGCASPHALPIKFCIFGYFSPLLLVSKVLYSISDAS